MREKAVLGVDIGGTKTFCALVDERHEILAAEKFRTAPEDGRKKFIDELIGASKALIKDARKEKITVIGVGVAVAGQVNNGKGDVQVAPNLMPLQNLNLRRLFQQNLKLDTCLGNDVQLALYAEHRLGTAVGCNHVLGVFFGTGIGGAAIIDGQLYRGASGLGGQVGAIITHAIGGADALQSHGILDRMTSKAAIAGAALGLAARQSAPHLFKEVGTDLAEVSWGALRRSIRKGDKAVEDLLRARLRLAGIALSNVVNFLNPEMLVLGGGLAEEMPQLLRAEVEKALRSHLVPEVSRALRVKLARFRNKAGAMGAARLAFETFG
jgi:glucokinase